ncbi:insulinase family protein [Canibacter sp. lx-72]|uniref:M16 family metallopeptidase n=1 Tax=Canibacter zhuwentaonis TaxID=2837491 RepID=UPI001BDD412D|nr:pitrilysin family protein [Canibacter zhuwentaonis]MBT1017951.1 insulinase family protein [Canibacter zhuwentaonis]
MTEPILLPHLQPEFSINLNGVQIRRTLLPNGLRILTENIPGMRSVALGYWVGVGSADEQADKPTEPVSLGSTHFLEHLLFKGTASRSAYQIAEEFDMMGAQHNAMTAKEFTCYHAKVRDTDLAHTVALLSDMVCASVLDEREFELERGVILEELAMAADDHEDLAHETFFETVLPDSALGRPIGGTPEIIRAANRQSVWQHYQQHYTPAQLVVTAAGAVDHEEFVKQVSSSVAAAGESWDSALVADPAPRRASVATPEYAPHEANFIQRSSEQVHLLLGGPGLKRGDSRRFAFSVLNSIFGDGMSSRLFQEIREKHGLAYTAYSFGSSYAAGGVFGMYAACAPEKAARVIQIAKTELEKIASEPVSDAELARAVGQLGGSAALALESSETRMARLARAELGSGEFWDLDTAQERIAAVSKADITELAGYLLGGLSTTVAVGDIARAGLVK